MRARSLFFVGGVTACARVSSGLDEYGGPADAPRTSDAAYADGSGNAVANSDDAGPCDECEYFPETCSPDVLCPNGPFGADSPGGGFDPRTSINAIRGRSIRDVWAVGALGAVAHFDGTSWTRSDLGSRETMRAIWLRDFSEVSLGILDHVYARRTGVEGGGSEPSTDGWAIRSPSYSPEQRLSSVMVRSAWAGPGSEWLWCAAQGWGSGLWRIRQSPSAAFEGTIGAGNDVCNYAGCNAVYGLHGSSAHEIWAVGQNGGTARISNATGDRPDVKAFDSQTRNALNGVWEASATEAWSVGAMGTIRHYTGDPLLWNVVTNVPTSVDLNAVWGSSPSDVWAVGDASTVIHFDGNSWSRVKVAGLGVSRPNLTTVWIAAPGHVWIGGQGIILSLGGKS